MLVARKMAPQCEDDYITVDFEENLYGEGPITVILDVNKKADNKTILPGSFVFPRVEASDKQSIASENLSQSRVANESSLENRVSKVGQEAFSSIDSFYKSFTNELSKKEDFASKEPFCVNDLFLLAEYLVKNQMIRQEKK